MVQEAPLNNEIVFGCWYGPPPPPSSSLASRLERASKPPAAGRRRRALLSRGSQRRDRPARSGGPSAGGGGSTRRIQPRRGRSAPGSGSCLSMSAGNGEAARQRAEAAPGSLGESATRGGSASQRRIRLPCPGPVTASLVAAREEATDVHRRGRMWRRGEARARLAEVHGSGATAAVHGRWRHRRTVEAVVAEGDEAAATLGGGNGVTR